MTLAYLFPGQGSQRPGMLRDLPDAVRAEAADVIGTLDDALRSSTDAQLALLIAGVAAARTLTDDHALPPDLVAGHSVGAFAAAVTAGVLTFAEAIEAVRLRGTLMEEACAGADWGMAALRGVSLRAAETLVRDSAGPLWIANVNAADQVVLSGTGAALAGVGGRRLDVTVASHCPLQDGTATRLAEHLGDLPRRRQTVPYLTCAGGRRVRDDAGAVLDDLARSVAVPVRWYDAMRLLGELGTTCAIQLPPGDVLARLLPAAAPDVQALAVDDAGLARTAARARRHL
jgi:malonate decarboxylase epsilon subunit